MFECTSRDCALKCFLGGRSDGRGADCGDRVVDARDGGNRERNGYDRGASRLWRFALGIQGST